MGNMTKDEVAYANAASKAFKKRTGQPLYVHQSQYDHFRSCGLDMRNFKITKSIPLDRPNEIWSRKNG